MNWKSILLKFLKGAFSGAGSVVTLGGLAGVPLTGHGLAVAGSAVASGAFHGAWHVAEEMLGNK